MTTTKKSSSSKKSEQGFSAEEKAVMKERAKELKAEAKAKKNREEGEKAILEKIAEMEESSWVIAKRLHEIILKTAPELFPRTWYGMSAYAKDDKVLVFFQSADKFNTRYSTLGFNDVANLDEGTFWPTAYAVTKLTPEIETQVVNLIKKAVS